ncbi:unnamed protein product, partial [Rotaria socialis]
GLRLQRCNFRLMLIRSFRDGVLDCFKLFQLWKSQMELALTVWCRPRVCILF